VYPALYFSQDLPFPRSHRVFVAMQFSRMEERWEKVIQPAIRRIELHLQPSQTSQPLEPFRVDNRQVSDSILTDILAGIAQSVLVFADITALDELNKTPIRNANVLYELGLAHAVRLPEEVVVFRSDSQPMLFDLANIRVNTYAPESDPATAIEKLTDALINAIKESEGRSHHVVKSLVGKLDVSAMWVLMEANAGQSVPEPQGLNMGQILAHLARRQAIRRLLELGLLSAELVKWSPDALLVADLNAPMPTASYRITPLGKAVARECISQWGFDQPSVRETLNKIGSFAKEAVQQADPTVGG
jgi:hypothetical protein